MLLVKAMPKELPQWLSLSFLRKFLSWQLFQQRDASSSFFRKPVQGFLLTLTTASPHMLRKRSSTSSAPTGRQKSQYITRENHVGGRCAGCVRTGDRVSGREPAPEMSAVFQHEDTPAGCPLVKNSLKEQTNV